MPEVTITCSVPPSVNATRGEHWTKTRRRKRRLQAELAILLLHAELPRPIPGDRVHATAVIVHPVERRRDEGNFRAALEKALGDALSPHDHDALNRWLSDDTPEHFTFGAITFETGPGLPHCDVTLTYGAALEAAA